MRHLTFLLAFVLFITPGCGGEAQAPEQAPVRQTALEQPVPEPDSTTKRLFAQVMNYARENDLHERPLGEIMQELGLQFEGKPYMAGLLDEPDSETLICRLDGFDCVTFVEAALAMARAIRQQDYSYDSFALNTRDQRYRGGEMGDYCSRLHYFSDWIADNERRGNVENITEQVGGEPLDKTINFMTSNRKSYPRFATNDTLFACIQEMEANLADVELFYIPQHRIRDAYDQLQAGDIIATATSIKGLDVTHTGLVYKHDGGTGFLHASLTGGVKTEPDLQNYITSVKKQIGIIVARPKSTSI